MSGDINVQTFSGKVNITSNLLVGSSHLFVDTTNNRVGITTADPDAGLHVNSNAYVDTNFRVGSDIAMNVTSGRITAGSFEGNGSLLNGVNSDSGSWVKDDTNGLIYVANSAHKVGIGTTNPATPFELVVGTDAAPLTSETTVMQLKSTVDGSTSDHACYFKFQYVPESNPVNWTDWSGRIQFVTDTTNQGYMEFNPSGSEYGIAFGNTGGGSAAGEIMRLLGTGNVGIGTVSPDKKLHVYGSIQCHNTGNTGDENGLFLQSVGDWYNLSPGNDGYLHLLGGASGQGNMSGNFSSMKLAKLITYSDVDVNGNINISSGNKVRINGDDAVFPRRTLVNGTSYSLTNGSWTKLCDFGHNYLDGAYAIKIEWNYGGTGHYWAGMATGMVPAKSYTHVQYNNAPDEPLSLNHFYHHRAVGRFEFTLDSDNYWGGSYGRIALWVKGGSTATHQF